MLESLSKFIKESNKMQYDSKFVTKECCGERLKTETHLE